MRKTARKAQRVRGLEFADGSKGPALSTPGLKTARRPDRSEGVKPNPGDADRRRGSGG
jgi:hypothetical protein